MFNGDFNFFNAGAKEWEQVNAAVNGFGRTGATAIATLGNVEFEVAQNARLQEAILGCGCAQHPAPHNEGDTSC